MIFTRIIVPTDGTEASLRGLDVAVQLVVRYAAELVVVTAVSVPDWLARQNMEYGAIESYVEGNAQKVFEAAGGPTAAGGRGRRAQGGGRPGPGEPPHRDREQSAPTSWSWAAGAAMSPRTCCSAA